ncbi:MAG: glutamine-hydrolyzing carbamoyl-phosphate synthase small subunit, partial [Gammaproteobacteria bacterium]
QRGTFAGEVVFNTGMAGYIESLTDPSYAGQILAFTYPLIGNYGVSEKNTWESMTSHVKGVVVSQIVENYSNYTAKESLYEWLVAQQIPFITDIDTRALTKRLRNYGVVPGVISDQSTLTETLHDLSETDWVSEVTTNEVLEYGAGEKLVIAVDCGMKENILRQLLQFPWRIKRVPYDYDYTNDHFDAVFLSNGPGDPERCDKTIKILQKALAIKKPIFGICLGCQLMGLAIGAKTYKLPYGHRSQNQPCLDLKSNRAYLTSQNHGYAVEENSLPKDWKVTFKNLNDNTVAGIAHESLPFFSVQFHPEAAPGPEDAQWLFQEFYRIVQHA